MRHAINKLCDFSVPEIITNVGFDSSHLENQYGHHKN